MKQKTFTKLLSANDVGQTGAHQAGILVPKSETELLEFLPHLDPSIKNPDAHLTVIDENGVTRKLRYIYYNNRMHDEKGTRNEYRITHLTKYFKETGVKAGDSLILSGTDEKNVYQIKIIRQDAKAIVQCNEEPHRIKISTGWRRIH